MADKIRQSLFWKVALYYGVLIVLLLVLVGIVQPEWLKYLPWAVWMACQTALH